MVKSNAGPHGPRDEECGGRCKNMIKHVETMYEEELRWGIEVIVMSLSMAVANLPKLEVHSWVYYSTGMFWGWNGMEWMEVSHEDRCYWGDDIYMAYDHPDALLLPDAKRSVSLQILCLRNLLQNVSTILDHDILPTFPTSRRAIPCHVLAESSCWYALQARDSQAD